MKHCGEEAGPSKLDYKKGHMTNIYLPDSDEEAIVDFVKDNEELYDKTSEHFKDKTRKESPWEKFGRTHKGHFVKKINIKMYFEKKTCKKNCKKNSQKDPK